jgi:hypothetical protein
MLVRALKACGGRSPGLKNNNKPRADRPPLASPPPSLPQPSVRHIPPTYPGDPGVTMALLYAHPAKRALEACEGSIGHPRAPDAHICRNGCMLPPSLPGLVPHRINTVETHAPLSYPTGADTCAENCPPAPLPLPEPPEAPAKHTAQRNTRTHME